MNFIYQTLNFESHQMTSMQGCQKVMMSLQVADFSIFYQSIRGIVQATFEEPENCRTPTYNNSINMTTLFWPEQSSHFLTLQHCLRHRQNLTSVSTCTCNVSKSVLVSFFWAPNSLNKLPEILFVFPFNLTGKSTMAFLTDQSCCILKSWYTGFNQKFTSIYRWCRLY